jgi:hypothetical protein
VAFIAYIDTGDIPMHHFQSRIIGAHSPRQFLALSAIHLPAVQSLKG